MFQELELGSPRKILTKNQNRLETAFGLCFVCLLILELVVLVVSDFAWKYESWTFTFGRKESWHFCYQMTPRAGAWGKNIKHCQVFYKIVRLAVSVLSQFRLQGWPILSTVPYWILIALWILKPYFILNIVQLKWHSSPSFKANPSITILG